MGKTVITNPSKRPAKRKKVAGKRVATVKKTAPARRKTSTTKRHKPHKRRVFRRNPSGRKGAVTGVVGNIVPSAVAAVGAIGVDVAWGVLPIPTSIKSGPMRHVAKAVGAVGFGALVHAVLPRETANQMSAGALTVVMHDAMKDMLGKAAPTLALGEIVNIHELDNEYDNLDLGDSTFSDTLADSSFNESLDGWGDDVSGDGWGDAGSIAV